MICITLQSKMLEKILLKNKEGNKIYLEEKFKVLIKEEKYDNQVQIDQIEKAWYQAVMPKDSAY